jgi:hypothetical protein
MFKTVSTQQIVDAIVNHIRSHGGPLSAWYCGITADPNDRLVNGHNAGGSNCHAAYWDCGSEAVARQVEQALLDAGCKGGPGGGDGNAKYVYVYKITSQTRE